MSDDRVKFAYYDVNGGKVTAAFKILGNRNDPVRTIQYACSFCSPLDRFEKPKGRLIASNRLNCARTAKTISVPIEYNNKENPIYKQVITLLSKYINTSLPRKVKWLNN